MCAERKRFETAWPCLTFYPNLAYQERRSTFGEPDVYKEDNLYL